jgi:hypothetical protein
MPAVAAEEILMPISRSQAGQDLLVRLLTDFSPTGYFVDIGCNQPVFRNNTYELEQLGWTGLLIDCDATLLQECKRQRKSSIVLADLRTVSLRDIFTAHDAPAVIDYVSFDVDNVNDIALMTFPFDTHRFRIMTFEHDAYYNGPALRDKSRQVIQAAGYTLICHDVKHGGNPYEDWYVDADLFAIETLDRFRLDNVEYTQIFEKYGVTCDSINS